MPHTLPKLLVIWIATASAACSGPSVTIGGTITGLDGTGLVLTNNGGDELAVTGNGMFSFETPLKRGARYALAVKHQPSNPTQTCSIANASGTAGDADVTDVQVSCQTAAFRIGGTVTGLAGAGLVLQNGAGDFLSVNADGTFSFATPVASGASYDVRIATQPSLPTQACTVANGTGSVGGSDVTDITVTCVTSSFTIGGTVSGLLGSGMVLRNNGADDLEITADGSFTFATPIASGSQFEVTVQTQPALPSQTCMVFGGTGTVGGGDVTSVAINCTTNSYTIFGTISGLVGTVTLQNNGGDDLVATANGTFAFSTPVLSGATYNVTVGTQPTTPSQTCTVTAGSGTVTDAHISSVVVTCTTNSFNIGGTLSGLASGNSITLRNNGGDDLVLSASGGFTFPTQLLDFQPYAVTIVESPVSPVSQQCMVTDGAGQILGSDVTNVQVTCTTNAFTIGGTVSGLTGTGLVLRNNGGDDLPITADGSFTFATPVASGATHTVTVRTHPTAQSCVVAGGAGTVGAGNVTGVQVTCGDPGDWSTTLFPIAVPGTGFGVGDLVLDGNGDLLVTTSPARSVVRVTRETGAQTTVATGIGTGSVLLGLTYRAANDRIYAATETQIFEVTPTGMVTVLAPVESINAMAIAPPSFGSFGGFIIGVTQFGRVVAVNPANGEVTTITTAAGAASDLAFAPDGTLYISGATAVRTVTAAGVVATFASNFGSADGITITPDGGRMFIADSSIDTIWQVTIPGAVRTTFATADIDNGFGVGGILAAPGNTLIVMTGETSLTLVAFTY